MRGVHVPRWRFHLSDCLFITKKNILEKVVNLAIENYTVEEITYRPPESRIWRNYFIQYFKELNIDIMNVSDEEYVKLMTELVEIMDVNTFKPFILRLNLTNNTMVDYPNTNKTTYEYLLHGC